MACQGCAARRAAIVANTAKVIDVARTAAQVVTGKVTVLPADVAAMAVRFAQIRRR